MNICGSRSRSAGACAAFRSCDLIFIGFYFRNDCCDKISFYSAPGASLEILLIPTGGGLANTNLFYFSADGIHFFCCLFYRHRHAVDKDIPATETSIHLTDFSRKKTNVAVGPS
jgi:hypothetical protein